MQPDFKEFLSNSLYCRSQKSKRVTQGLPKVLREALQICRSTKKTCCPASPSVYTMAKRFSQVWPSTKNHQKSPGSAKAQQGNADVHLTSSCAEVIKKRWQLHLDEATCSLKAMTTNSRKFQKINKQNCLHQAKQHTAMY